MKKIIYTILTIAIASFAFAAPKEPKLILDKISDKHFYLDHIKKDSIDANGVLHFSTKNKWYTYMFCSKEGVLKNGKLYQFDFEVKVKGEFSKEKLFDFIVRDLDKSNYSWWRDIANIRRYKAAHDDFEKVSVRFEIPRDGKKYSLTFHTMNADVELKNLKLYETNDLKEIPITTNTTNEKVDLGKLPTGAKEFDVDMPRPAKTLVVNAHDFGLSESSTENHIAIRKAIEHCKKVGASKLTMKKGVYKCFGEDAGAFNFVGFKDFTFDGGGSTFVMRRVKPVPTFWIDRCERFRLYNFELDWDWETDPLASLATVINVGEEVVDGKKTRFFDLEFYEYKNDTHPFYNKYIRIAHMSEYDPVKKAVGVEDGKDKGFGYLEHFKGPRTKWLDKNKLRVSSALSTAV